MSGEAGMGREKRGKQTLRKKMMVVMLISAMSSILAVVIVSYMTIRMIQNDSIQESMQIYLEQITREMDSAYYDMISIVNQMSCIFRKNRALAPHERSAVPLGTDHCPVG